MSELVGNIKPEEKEKKRPSAKARIGKMLRLLMVPVAMLAFSTDSPIHKNEENLNSSARSVESAKKELPIHQDAISLYDGYFNQKESFDQLLPPSSADILNSQTSSDAEYIKAIIAWPQDVPIFLYLDNFQAKERLIKFILAMDDLDSYENIMIHYGPDVDGDGIIELNQKEDGLYSEAGELIDEYDFVCSEFADELMKRYGIHVFGLSKSTKYQLPMMRASVGQGFVDADGFGVGHSINAIYLGSSMDEYNDISKWYFLEPQSDLRIVDPFEEEKYKILSLSTLHFIGSDDVGDSLVSFVKTPQELFIMNDQELQIWKLLEKWTLTNKMMRVEDDDRWSDEANFGTFQTIDLYRVARLAYQSQFLSFSQVSQAFEDSLSLPSDFDFNELMMQVVQ